MVNVYIVISALFILQMIGCSISVKKSDIALKDTFIRLMEAGIFSLVSNLVHVIAKDYFVSMVGFCLFSLSIDWMLLAFLRFTANYVGKNTIKHSLRNLYFFLTIVDTISLLLNLKFEHVCKLSEKPLFGNLTILEATNFSAFYYAHLIVCYVMVLRIFYLLGRGFFNSSSYFKTKYSGVLALFAVVIVMDGLSVVLNMALNVGVIFYGLLVLALYYFSVKYIPSKLVSQMQYLVMEHMDSGIICFDENGKCVYTNDLLWKIVGSEKNIELAEQEYAKVEDDLKVVGNDYKMWNDTRIVDGEERFYELSSRCIRDDKNIFIGCYFRISDLTQVKREYDARLEREKAANKAKSDFLSQVSHEIRTPVNSIYGMNEMILRESNEKEIINYAAQIRTATDSLITIINDILDFSKIEAGRMEVVKREYRTEDMLRNVCDIIRIKAEEKGLYFKTEISKSIPSGLFGDDIRIAQILMNLLSNAVKYTAEGGVTLLMDWEQEEEESFLKISVSDTGMGIKEEDIPHLFSAFARMDEQKNHGIQGTGLGLSITNQLIQLMGSELKVYSVYGMGSTFFCRIAQGVVDETGLQWELEKKQVIKKVEYNPSFVAPDAKVLVVDDNNINRVVFKNLLKRTQVQITQASSGAECLELIQKEHFDIIFMDHMMPEMDGVEAFRKMQEMEHMCKGVPVVMLTANAIEGAMEEYLGMGFSDFLGKPIIPAELEKMVWKYIGAAAE